MTCVTDEIAEGMKLDENDDASVKSILVIVTHPSLSLEIR